MIPVDVCHLLSSVFSGSDDKNKMFKAWKGKLNNIIYNGKSTVNSAANGISMAMDSRLENGIEQSAELRLKVCFEKSCTYCSTFGKVMPYYQKGSSFCRSTKR